MPEEQNLTEALFARGALMGLHIGRWTAVKKMAPTDMLMGEVDLDAIYLGHKKLLPKKAMEKLVELEGKARVALSSRSMEFPIAGARFVTYSTLPTVVSKLEELKEEWAREVEELIARYPALRESQLFLLSAQAEKFVQEELRKVLDATQLQERREELLRWLSEQMTMNNGFYPAVDQLRLKFSFSWRMFTISALQGINELDVAEVREAQERLRADLQSWVRSATASMHQALGEASANAKAILEKHGKLTAINLKPLFNAFESFLMVDFTGQSTFRETIETIKKRFLVSNPDGTYNLTAMAESMSSEVSKAEFNDLLSKMGELAVEDTAAQAGILSLSRTDFGRMVEL